MTHSLALVGATTAMLTSVLVVGCSSDSAVRQRPTTTGASPTTSAPHQTSPSATPDPLEPLVAGSTRVSFQAVDGVRLDGRVFGAGHVGIVLSHMGRGSDNQGDWYATAVMLARRGYLVLTYDRRGVCPGGIRGCSGGTDVLSENWKDVVGAYEYLRSRGARRIVLGGASIGAMGTLYAVQHANIEPAGVVWIAGVLSASGYTFTKATASQVTVPQLLLAGNHDPYGAGHDAALLSKWLGGPNTLLIVASVLHGTDMLQPDGPRVVRERIDSALLTFLRTVAPTERNRGP